MSPSGQGEPGGGPNSGKPRGASTVLVIDDDQKFCRLLTGYLEMSGYEVTSPCTTAGSVSARCSPSRGTW